MEGDNAENGLLSRAVFDNMGTSTLTGMLQNVPRSGTCVPRFTVRFTVSLLKLIHWICVQYVDICDDTV